jgi:NAD(P)H-hydrate epimerase
MDADAINICSLPDDRGGKGTQLLASASRYYSGNVIITPHMAEMARLMNRISLEDKAAEESGINIEKNAVKCDDTEWSSLRVRDAYMVANRYNITVVLKDARTHVVSPGENLDIYVNLPGNSGMSKGGSGDVLTGIMAAVIAGKARKGHLYAPMFAQTVAVSVMLHGAAGDAARELKGEYSMLAGDIIDALERIL